MRFFAAAALALTLTWPAAAAEGWQKDYRVIRIGISSAENEADRIARYQPWKEYLQRALGVQVELFTAGSYDGIIQALASDQIEAASIGSSAYAAAYTETKGGVVPLLTTQDRNNATGYYSVIAVRCDSGYRTLEDLRGKVVAFADPDSTSGYAVPFYNLVQQDRNPRTFFAATPFSGSHEAGVQGVVNGQFDAAATYISDVGGKDGVPQRMVSKGMIQQGQICFVWTSPEITNGPLTVRANLPAGLTDAIRRAYMEAPQADPEAFKAITGGETSGAKGYVEVSHDRYQWIVDMRAWLKAQRRR
jgi:phosphonate transport system substrate-binding protein